MQDHTASQFTTCAELVSCVLLVKLMDSIPDFERNKKPFDVSVVTTGPALLVRYSYGSRLLVSQQTTDKREEARHCSASASACATTVVLELLGLLLEIRSIDVLCSHRREREKKIIPSL